MMRNSLKFTIGTLIFLLILNNQNVFAQDKLLFRGKQDTLLVKVIELGVLDIRYRMFPVDTTMPVMVESKEKVRKIIFENGTIMKFAEDEFTNSENYVNQKKMAIKLDFFSPIRKVLSASIEYSMKPGMSAEFGIGAIGLGTYSNGLYTFKESDGGFIRAGIKFINTPDYRMSGMRYTHILKGGYIKPEFMYLFQNNFGQNYSISYFYDEHIYDKAKVNGYALFINFGKQWVMSDIICVDFYIGPGIGSKHVSYEGLISNGNDIEKYLYGRDTGYFGFMSFATNNGALSFCLQTGLKVGFLLGTKNN